MKRLIYALILFSTVYLSSCQKNSVEPNIKQSDNSQKSVAGSTTLNPSGTVADDTTLNNINGSLRIQLAKDTINNDNIFISFNPTAATTYNGMEDAPSFQGFGAVSLSSISSDNVPLAINTLPLTKTGLTIALKVNATNDGAYTLDMLAIKNVPDAMNIWLRDSYKKDSVDFRHNSTYAFKIAKADTNSFGSHRFNIVLRPK